MDFRLVVPLAAAILTTAVTPANAQLPTQGPPPGAYRENDSGGFLNVLPPGENGFDNAADLARFEAGGGRPAHADDQLPLYRDLLPGYGSLAGDGDLSRYFKDAS